MTNCLAKFSAKLDKDFQSSVLDVGIKQCILGRKAQSTKISPWMTPVVFSWRIGKEQYHIFKIQTNF